MAAAPKSASRALRLLFVLGAASAAAACGRAPAPAQPASTNATGAPEAGFLAPPTRTGAVRAGDGRVTLQGRAAPGARVRLASPTGEMLQALSSRDGAWMLSLPPAATPRLFAVSGELAGRTLRGEGALAVTPAGSLAPALLLRSGAPALIAGAPGSAAAVLVSVDFDAGGGFAASGMAAPGRPVAMALDGASAGQDHADPAGRFGVLAVAAPAKPGAHDLAVRAQDGGQSRRVDLSPASPLTSPYRATRTAGGWRVDWASPGGAVQSVLVFDTPAAAGGPALGPGDGREDGQGGGL